MSVQSISLGETTKTGATKGYIVADGITIASVFADLMAQTEENSTINDGNVVTRFMNTLTQNQTDISQETQETLHYLFSSAGIDMSKPVQFKVDADGNIYAGTEHPDHEKINALLEYYPALKDNLQKLAAMDRITTALSNGVQPEEVTLSFSFAQEKTFNLKATYDGMSVDELIKMITRIQEISRAYMGHKPDAKSTGNAEPISKFAENNEGQQSQKKPAATTQAEQDMFDVIDEYGSNLSEDERNFLKAKVTKGGVGIATNSINLEMIAEKARQQEELERMLKQQMEEQLVQQAIEEERLQSQTA